MRESRGGECGLRGMGALALGKVKEGREGRTEATR